MKFNDENINIILKKVFLALNSKFLLNRRKTA